MLIDNREIPKGTKQKWNFVAAEMTVNRIEVPVTVINGAKDGPVLSITAGVHPNERRPSAWRTRSTRAT